jgi:hypothetical protein
VKRYIFFIFFIISFAAAAQQYAFELWHEGKVVLETSDTIKGLLKYDIQNDFLQVKKQNKLESFTARKVLAFEIFDASVKRYRQFYSLPYSQNNTYKTPVLTREKLEYRTVSSPFFYYGTYSTLVLVNQYYLLKPNGLIEDFVGRKSDWLAAMENREAEVREYAKVNRLDFDDKYELVRIVDYYNSLFVTK